MQQHLVTKVGGEIVFSGIDLRHFKGEHTYVRLTQKDYWRIEVGDILIANKPKGYGSYECINIIHNYGDSIWEYIISGPKTICEDIGLCSYNRTFITLYNTSHFPLFTFKPTIMLLKQRCIMKVGANHKEKRALYKLPNLVGQTFIDYNDIANVPQITFTIGNKSFPLSPEQI
ncbi:Cyprosin [Glycine soja]